MRTLGLNISRITPRRWVLGAVALLGALATGVYATNYSLWIKSPTAHREAETAKAHRG